MHRIALRCFKHRILFQTMAVNKWTLFCSLFVLLVSNIGDVDAQVCGNTVYTQPSGTITSPYYPADYRDYMNCNYEIRASQSSSFTLTFETFHLEDCCSCDWVQIRCHDGSTETDEYCGQSDPPTTVITNCDKVLVEFRSDGSMEYTGFSLRYSFTPGGSTHKPTTMVTTKPTTKTSTTTKSTTKMSTISTTSVASNDTMGDSFCEPSDDVPLIVVSMLLGICVLGYIVLAAIFIVWRCRQRTSRTDAESTESPRTASEYATTQPASRILRENIPGQNRQWENSLHRPTREGDAHHRQDLRPDSRLSPRSIYVNLTYQN